MKSLNDLHSTVFKRLMKELTVLFSLVSKGINALAEKYSVDKNELFECWLYMSNSYFSQTDMNTQKGLTVEEGMNLLKNFLRIGKQGDNK